MIVLLDTHALLWALADSPRLSANARAVIEDTGNIVLVSVASAWEIAIKTQLGRLSAPDDLEAVIEAAGFTKRPITFADARLVATLPAHHRDPFDRMLVCQALQDGATIVSTDSALEPYGAPLLW